MTFFITPFHYTDCFSVRQIGYGGRRDAQTALLMEIRRLGAEDQDILMLKYDNKFTVVQIAQALNMDAQVVKKRLQRIRARLKSALEEKGYDTI